MVMNMTASPYFVCTPQFIIGDGFVPRVKRDQFYVQDLLDMATPENQADDEHAFAALMDDWATSASQPTATTLAAASGVMTDAIFVVGGDLALVSSVYGGSGIGSDGVPRAATDNPGSCTSQFEVL